MTEIRFTNLNSLNMSSNASKINVFSVNDAALNITLPKNTVTPPFGIVMPDGGVKNGPITLPPWRPVGPPCKIPPGKAGLGFACAL